MKLRYDFSNKNELDYLHECTLDILKDTGVVFSQNEAIEIFKKNGIRAENHTVFLDEKDINKALESTPSSFEWMGLKSNLTIGSGK